MRKTLKAVFSPQKFTPAIIDHADGFEQAWEVNRPWVFANLAHMAYFNEPEILSFTSTLGARLTRFYDIDGAQAYLTVWDSKSVLAFRGSQPRENDDVGKDQPGLAELFGTTSLQNLRFEPRTMQFLSNDVLADLKFRKVPFDDSLNVQVHRGFLGEINKVWLEIGADIELHASDVPVWVTGHSLGAAMATLAGMRFPFEGVVTFGEPRVGINIDKTFKAGNHVRFVNGDDPVTKVPPEKVFRYDHHGIEERISDPDGRTDFQYDHSIIYYSDNLA